METGEGIVTKKSARTVSDTVAHLVEVLRAKGLMVFAVVDHSGEAAKVGMAMPDTKLVIFGSPAAGTPVMLEAPLAALDLPLKILVWADTGGAAFVSYNSPAYVAARYGLSDHLRARLEPIEALSDAAAGP
jgi:uncharacterized protein (DUF302 family)